MALIMSLLLLFLIEKLLLIKGQTRQLCQSLFLYLTISILQIFLFYKSYYQFNQAQLLNTRHMSQNLPVQEATCKKIQNYIFNFSDLLGKGNFSKVYKAHNEVTKEVVAIKIIELNSLKSKKLEELLFSEIEILKRLNHPNVLRCFEVFTSNRNCYIITQLCNEGDLESKLKSKRIMKEFQAKHYIEDIFKGLTYLADNFIVHRDLKVANIFVHNGTAKIADFGFAKYVKQKFKDINIGSPIYMSPQGLIDNIYGPKTDVWAFGMLIYELLHGETPFSHCKSENQLKYNISIPIGWSQLKPQLSSEIKELILKCLQVDDNKRISAFDLKKLSFFKHQMGSPIKIQMKELVANSYEYKINEPIKNDSINLPYKSDNNFYNQKFRVKTENQLYPMKIRQYSEITTTRYQTPSQTLKHEKSSNSNFKLSVDQQKNRRLSTNKYSSSTNLVMNSLSKINNLNSKDFSNIKNDAILSAPITFKECVNILHYCRLVFKHLVLMKEINFGDESQTSIFKRWLSTILKTLMREINEKKIIYEGENRMAREKKLEEVTSEYIKKYSRELNLDLSKIRLEESLIINYEKIYNYFISIYQMIDQLIQKDSVNKSLLQLAHSILVICDTTKTMKSCYEDGKYKRIEKLKEIQQFLAINKQQLDFPSYQWYRKKCLM